MVIFDMMLIPQSLPPAPKTGCALPHSSLPGEENTSKTTENTSGSTKDNKTTISIFSNESRVTLLTLKTSPQPEQMSTTPVQRSLHAPAEQIFAAPFSTRQSNPQQLVASAQKSEATFPNSLNRAVAKLKRDPKPRAPVQRCRYRATCSTRCQRAVGDSQHRAHPRWEGKRHQAVKGFNISLSHHSLQFLILN